MSAKQTSRLIRIDPDNLEAVFLVQKALDFPFKPTRIVNMAVKAGLPAVKKALVRKKK